jgi:ATP-binding protein involved in chromosome partitioning
MIPPINYGVKVTSIGMFVDDNAVSSECGPMLHRTVQQFHRRIGDPRRCFSTLPPGTGDVAISLGSCFQHAEVNVVTTPCRVRRRRSPNGSATVARQTGQR